MHFLLTLHSHLPYVLNHGRWPHGSDWLCEATLDTYLPLLEAFHELEADEIPSPVTLGITPVLANQLASPLFVKEVEAFFQQRLEACDVGPASLAQTRDEALLPLVEFWREHFLRLRELFRRIDGDLLGAFRKLEENGRLEIISSAATHGFLPLLGREESIRLQLAVGASEHLRLLGRPATGCWIPECAYRSGGSWDPVPGLSTPGSRLGLEAYLAEAGFRYFFIDTHMAEAGESLGAYGDVPHGVERFDASWEGRTHPEAASRTRSPYQSFKVTDPNTGTGAAAFVREPDSSLQVWSRDQGYPGDGWYLEFHKIRWPGGLKYWRVTGPAVDLGGKQPYEPERARGQLMDHATHFAGLLGHLGRRAAESGGKVAMAPFDTELLGHWWFEGVAFFKEVFRQLPVRDGVTPMTASQSLEDAPPETLLRPLDGSWGADGDFSMWLNDETRWTWERLWTLEDAFWGVAREALSRQEARPILAQAARQLLLAQSSDWQFMISTGAVPDYAERRFNLHCDDLETLVRALEPGASEDPLDGALARARELEVRDDLFPDVLDSVADVLTRS
jgi:1,4-alpha-glucan branching enzyme